MASTPTRQSIDLSPDLSELMDKLKKHASSFIREFDSSDHRMSQIVREISKIAAEVRRVGAGVLEVAAFGLLLGFLAGAAAGAAGAAGAAIFVAGVNVKKRISESESVNKVEELGKEFMKIVEPLMNILEEIMTTCEELKKRSAEDQAGITLRDMELFQRIIRRVSELGRSDGVWSDMRNIFTHTATPEEDTKLRVSIIQSADRCQKVIDDLEKMKEELKEFTEL